MDGLLWTRETSRIERPKTELTFRMDDEIVNDLFEKFPEFKFDDALRNLDEDWMKSKAGKEKWRAFIMPVSPEPTGSFESLDTLKTRNEWKS